MSGEQPFLHLFESLGRLPQSHSDAINREAYQALLEVLSVPLDHPGRCILLRAPRAGHGKTHLLSRIQHHLAPGHEFIPLHPASGCRIDAPSVIDDALRRLGRPLPAAGAVHKTSWVPELEAAIKTELCSTSESAPEEITRVPEPFWKLPACAPPVAFTAES